LLLLRDKKVVSLCVRFSCAASICFSSIFQKLLTLFKNKMDLIIGAGISGLSYANFVIAIAGI
jgi:hypothetical protein